MTRIVAGAAKGRRLAVPASGTRPTSDRVREALFSALESARGAWAGARVLDLYAGSGALGLEALSRGAACAVLVEKDRRAAATARDNVKAVALPGGRVVVDDVVRLITCADPAPVGGPFDVVLADPPYDVPDDVVESLLRELPARGWLAEGAVVVVERSSRGDGFAWPVGYEDPAGKAYGDTVVRRALWYGRGAPGR